MMDQLDTIKLIDCQETTHDQIDVEYPEAIHLGPSFSNEELISGQTLIPGITKTNEILTNNIEPPCDIVIDLNSPEQLIEDPNKKIFEISDTLKNMNIVMTEQYQENNSCLYSLACCLICICLGVSGIVIILLWHVG